MKSKNIKIVDQNNIDRDASVMFAFELEGSEYVSYWIERDDDENNLFVSRVLKNTDGTSNLLDIENEEEKTKVSEIVKTLITKSVKDESDKLVGETVTLDDGKVVKLVDVSFNKEQRINVPKTYITTVKKEVTKVTDEYYDVVSEEPSKVVEEIFPSVTPVVTEVTETVVVPTAETPILEPVETVVEETPAIVEVTPAVVEEPKAVEPTPVVSTPVVEVPAANAENVVVTEATTNVVTEPLTATIGVVNEPAVVESITVAAPVSIVEESTPETPVVAPIIPEVALSTPAPEVAPVLPAASVVETPVVMPAQTAVEVAPAVAEVPKAVEPTPVAPAPVVVPPVMEQPVVNNTLVFNASKETNLNAALGEAAKDTTIPVENIESVREFGEDAPLVNTTPAQPIAPMVQPEVASDPKTLTKKAGFANSKFFMVVAIAFFLASCVFLGYEVFNYFQLAK